MAFFFIAKQTSLLDFSIYHYEIYMTVLCSCYNGGICHSLAQQSFSGQKLNDLVVEDVNIHPILMVENIRQVVLSCAGKFSMAGYN